MPAPIVAAAAAGARVAAQAAGRIAVGAARVSGQAAKAGAQAAGRGAAAAARGGARAARSGAARGGRAAAQGAGSATKQAGRHAGSASKQAGKQAAAGARQAGAPGSGGPQLPPRQGWGYQQPPAGGASPARPAPGSGIDPARMAKEVLTRRLRRMVLHRLLRWGKKEDEPKSKKGKLKARLRKRRRWMRRSLVLGFAVLLLFPIVVGGLGGAQMNDAMAASEGGAGDDEFGRVSGIPYAEEFNKTADLGIDPRLVAAVAWAESSFDPDNIFCEKTSSAGAKGIMQLMPDTATALGVDRCKPPEAIHGGAQYLLEQHRKFGTWELALAAYNAGPGKVEAAGNKIPDIAETKAYVPKVMGRWDDYKAQFPGGTITGGGPPGGPLGGTERVVDSHNTATMQRVLDALVERFGRGRGIGCYRDESNIAPSERGEHGLGRACDFMMATGGQMPSEEYLEQGWAMANWLIAHAEEYNVRYIIWQKRIWQNGSWKPYTRYGNSTNRTLQHYDHVHLSVN